MANVLKAVPSGMAAFSAANDVRATTIASAASVDAAVLACEVAAALGPVCTTGEKPYLLECAPALEDCSASARVLVYLHAAIANATDASASAIVRADNA